MRVTLDSADMYELLAEHMLGCRTCQGAPITVLMVTGRIRLDQLCETGRTLRVQWISALYRSHPSAALRGIQ